MPKSKLKKYFLKIRLVKLAIYILLTIIFINIIVSLWVHNTKHTTADKKPREVTIAESTHNAASNLRFYGLDSDNQPYSIEAGQAVQKSSKIVELDKVHATYTLKDDKLISVIGNAAYLNSESNILQINGDVTILLNDAYSLLAQSVQINYKDTNACGNTNIVLNSKFGNIQSEQFEIKDNYNNIKFFGSRVKTTLYPSKTTPEVNKYESQ